MAEEHQSMNQYELIQNLHSRIVDLEVEKKKLEEQTEIDSQKVEDYEEKISDLNEQIEQQKEEIKDLKSQLDDESSHNEINNYQFDTADQNIECPYCENVYALRGITNHLQTHDINISEFFEIDDGSFDCLHCDFRTDSFEIFKSHVNQSHDSVIMDLKERVFPELREEEETGKEEEQSHRTIESIENSDLKSEITDLFEDNSRTYTINEITDELFGLSSPKGYKRTKMHKALQTLVDNNFLRKTKNGSGINKYHRKKQVDIEFNYLEQAISKIGRSDYNLLKKSFFVDSDNRDALIPNPDSVKAINFYDFAAKNGDGNNNSVEDLWELILISEVLQKALASHLNDDLTFRVQSTDGSGGVKSKVLEMERS